MSIASEITRLQTAKSNIKTSIENKGVVVSSSDKLDDYPSLIDSINISTQEKVVNPQNYTREITPDVGYRGLSKVVLDGVLVDAHDSYTSNTDSSVAYTKSVPSGALKYASLDKLGGMSYKCLNLKDLNYPTMSYYRNNLTDFNATSDNSTTRIRTESFAFKPTSNKTYYLNNIPSGISLIGIGAFNSNQEIISSAFTSSGNSFSTTSSNVEYIFILFGGSNFDSNTKTLFTQIGIFESNNIYEPYFEGIRDTAITSVKSYGANLLNISDVAETTYLGITYKVQNGVIYLNGLSQNEISLYFTINEQTLNGTYYYYVEASGTTSNTLPKAFRKETTNVVNLTDNNTISVLNRIVNRILIYIPNATTITNYTYKPMLVSGSTAPTTYYPYRGLIETKTIPAEVQALTGYGWGVNDTCYNYIDYEAKKFIQKVARVKAKDLTFNTTSVSNMFSASDLNSVIKIVANNETANLLCNVLTTTTANSVYGKSTTNIIGVVNNGGIWIYVNDNITTVQELYNYFTDNDYIYYELATPIETDISSYIDDGYIEVEGNGSLTFDNTYEQAVPSEITYLVEV